MKRALILLILLLALQLAEGTDDLKEVPASEILVNISKGLPVEYDHVIVVGDLNLSSLEKLPTMEIKDIYGSKMDLYIARSPIRITDPLIDDSVDLNIVSSSIRISYSIIDSSVNFNNTLFKNEIDFSYSTFKNNSYFVGSEFNSTADFSDTEFNSYADFEGSNFNSIASFYDSNFSSTADFWYSEFNSTADFMDTEFNGNADFSDTGFNDTTYFTFSKFNGDAYFPSAEFNSIANFLYSKFNSYAYFPSAEFNGDFSFSNSKFNDNAIFSNAVFNSTAYFEDSVFNSTAGFGGSVFNKTYFNNSIFNELAYFDYATFKGAAYFTESNISTSSFNSSAFSSLADFSDIFVPKNGKIYMIDTNYNEILIDWETAKSKLELEPRQRISLYKKLRANYLQSDIPYDAYDCYYETKKLQCEQLGDWDARLLDISARYLYGYGFKPFYPLLWSFIIIGLFGLLYWWQGVSRPVFFSYDAFLSGTGKLLVDTPKLPEGANATVQRLFDLERMLGLLFFALFLIAIGNTIIK